MEKEYPGLWQHWYRHQCVAVGFAPYWGAKLRGATKDHWGNGWRRARAALLQIKVGDFVVVALKNHCVARLGQITDTGIEDDQWDPTVPVSKENPHGQMGRRIYVRWDLTCGPEDRDLVIALPQGSQFTNGERLPTLARIRSQSLGRLRAVMNNQANWIGLSHFKYEAALSDYIAAFPFHLEDGLVPYPNAKVRERVFANRKRLDVLLLDRRERPVIVECKQGAPTPENVQQLRGYMKSLCKETQRKDVRGILVHGGSRKLRSDVLRAASLLPRVEIVRYLLQIDFIGGSAS